jgi:hypothetical protein
VFSSVFHSKVESLTISAVPNGAGVGNELYISISIEQSLVFSLGSAAPRQYLRDWQEIRSSTRELEWGRVKVTYPRFCSAART